MLMICEIYKSKQFILIYCFLSFVRFLCVQCKYEYLIHAQKLPNYDCDNVLCKSIKCEEVKNCSDGVIVPHSSYCNCCPACIKFLDINDPCEEIHGSLRNIATNKCKQGLKCQNNRCDLDYNGNLNTCLLQRYLREMKRGKDNYADNLWVPECDGKGEYKAKQRKNRRNICVDEHGNKLFGNGENSQEKACACSRHMQKAFEENPLLYNIKPQEHCSPTGNFDKVQCNNNLCYCADEETGEVKGRLVTRDNLYKLPCYDDDKSERQYLKPCEVELQRSRHLAYEFRLKGVHLVGIETVKCDPDGSFAPTQCSPDRCDCTNQDGVPIGSYAISSENLEELKNVIMTCNCARDGSSGSSTFKCKGYGNYAYLQCFNSELCNCVDEDGDIVSKSLPKRSIDENYCLQLLQDLIIPEDGLRSTVTITDETDYYDYESNESH